MKRRKIALLLALTLTLTLTQGMGVTVPAVAEELLTDDGLDQEGETFDILDDEEMAEQQNVAAVSETEASESADAAANTELP